MKIVEPNVELWDSTNVSQESHIAHCARVCYGKEYKEPNPEADRKMVDGLIKRGHLSMLRHASVYLKYASYCGEVFHCNSPYWNDGTNEENGFSSTNLQEFNQCDVDDIKTITIISNKQFLEECAKYPELFKLYRITFCITTQIGTSRELNRKSPNAIAERSTRYCSSKDGLEICKPWWFKHSIEDITKENCTYAKKWYYDNMINTEKVYKVLLDTGMKPEDARGILPLDTATKVIYTYSVEEWQHILDLRLYDKTGRPHPNCHIVMAMVRDQINEFAKVHNIDYEV